MGLLDDDKKSLVGQAFDSFKGLLTNVGLQMYPSETYESGEAFARDMVDKGVEGLGVLGVPETVLKGKATTTKPNFYKSLDTAIYNLPSQVPRLSKELISAVYNPIDTAKDAYNATEGMMINAADVLNKAILPDSLLNQYEQVKDNALSDQSKANEKALETVGQSLLDPQVRREIGQNYGLELLAGFASVPKNFAKLGDKQTQFLERVVEDTAPFGNTIGTQMFGTRKSSTWNKEKFGSQIDAKTKAQRMFDEMGVNKESVAQVFAETNYFITPRGDLVHHINDIDMAFTPKVIKELSDMPKDVELDGMLGTYKAKDVFSHPELFRNYPELEDYDITLIAGLTRRDGSVSQVGRDADGKFVPTGLQGAINHRDKEIELYVDQSKGLTSDHKGILLHEIQHGVQNLDNLAVGGNSSVQNMVGLKQILEVEDKKINEQLKDPTLSDKQIERFNKRKENIAVGLEGLEIAATDPMTVSPKNAMVLRNVRENIYAALEGEWMARLTQQEKNTYEQIQRAIDSVGEDMTVNEFMIAEDLDLNPLSFADDGTSGGELLDNYPPEQVNGIIKKLYEGGLISSPDVEEFGRFVRGRNESRRLLSDSERGKGMIDGVYQDIDFRYGKDRIGDETLRQAINNRTIVPDYKIEGADVDEPLVSLFDYAGRGLASSMADTSATGGFTTEVAGKELAKKVARDGGQGFPYKFDGAGWSSAKGAITNITDSIENAGLLSKEAGYGDDPLFGAFQMKAAGIDFNVQETNSMVQSAIANLTNAELDKVDKLIKEKTYLKHYKDADGNKIKDSERVKLNPDWVGIRNLKKDTLAKLNGDQRKDIQRILDSNFKNKVGTKLEHQLANADPSQLRTEPLSLHNLILPDLSKGIKKSKHTTYSHEFAGKPLGRIEENVNLLDVIPVYDKEGVRITPESLAENPYQYKSVMGQKISGLLTEENIDFAIKQAKKRAKKNKK